MDPLAEGAPLTATAARCDEVHDLAVLTSATALAESANSLIATDLVALRTPVTVTGHVEPDDPGHTYRFIDASGAWAGGTVRDGTVPLSRVTADAVLPGMSGAPVVRDADGLVAGVVSGRYNSADGWLRDSVWVARADDLLPLLNGVTSDVTMREAPAGREGSPGPGSLLSELTDPFGLNVHRAIDAGPAHTGLPVLPLYMKRAHDAALSAVIAPAAAGTSKIVLHDRGLLHGQDTRRMGGSEETAGRLAAVAPGRCTALLDQLDVGLHVQVVWLDEIHLYLRTPGDPLGERAAGRVLALLDDHARAPVLVMGTTWPEYWFQLTAGSQGEDSR